MESKRLSRLAPALIAAAVLLPMLLLTVYVVGYYGLSKVSITTPNPNAINSFPYRDTSIEIRRSFKYYWLARIYEPAALVETVLRGVSVSATEEVRLLRLLDE